MPPRVEMALNGRTVTVTGDDGDTLAKVAGYARRLWRLTEPADTAPAERPAGASAGTGFQADHAGSYPTAVDDADPSRTGGFGGYIGL
jgi:hypothetical protein